MAEAKKSISASYVRVCLFVCLFYYASVFLKRHEGRRQAGKEKPSLTHTVPGILVSHTGSQNMSSLRRNPSISTAAVFAFLCNNYICSLYTGEALSALVLFNSIYCNNYTTLFPSGCPPKHGAEFYNCIGAGLYINPFGDSCTVSAGALIRNNLKCFIYMRTGELYTNFRHNDCRFLFYFFPQGTYVWAWLPCCARSYFIGVLYLNIMYGDRK